MAKKDVQYQPAFPYIGDQIIIDSDRVTINCKEDMALILAKKAVGISADSSVNIDTKGTFVVNAQKIKLGIGDDSEHPLVKGDILLALLKSNKTVLIYVRGQTDKVFKELEKKNGKLSIINKNPKSNIDEEFIELKEICIKFKPIKIITEIPLGLSTVLYMSKISSKILFWSAGFHQVPWFDYKLLVPEIYSDDHSKLPEFVKIPHSLNYELLNPFFELDIIDKVKKKYVKIKVR